MDPITITSIFAIGGKLIDKLTGVFATCFLCFGGLLSTKLGQLHPLAMLLFAGEDISCNNSARSFPPTQGLSLFVQKQKRALRRVYFWLARFVSPICSYLGNNQDRYQPALTTSRQGTRPYQQGSYQNQASDHTCRCRGLRSICTLGLSALCIACIDLPILCKSLCARFVVNARVLCFWSAATLWQGIRKILCFRIAGSSQSQAWCFRNRKHNSIWIFRHKTGLLGDQSAYPLSRSFSRA